MKDRHVGLQRWPKQRLHLFWRRLCPRHEMRCACVLCARVCVYVCVGCKRVLWTCACCACCVRVRVCVCVCVYVCVRVFYWIQVTSTYLHILLHTQVGGYCLLTEPIFVMYRETALIAKSPLPSGLWTSCSQLQRFGGVTESGSYQLMINNVQQDVFCDMTTDGLFAFVCLFVCLFAYVYLVIYLFVCLLILFA